MKKLLIITAIVVIGIIVLLASSQLLHNTTKVSTEDKGQFIQETDTLFDITYSYPKTWKKIQPFLGQGTIALASSIDPQTSITFWDSDSEKINNVDALLTFAQNDIKKDESNGLKTESLEKTTLNGKDAVLYKAKETADNKTLFHKRYYITDFNARGSHFYVWAIQVTTENKPETNDIQGVNYILNSFTILDDK